MSIVKIKSSNTASAAPSSLVAGELAINYLDKKIFYRDNAGAVQSFDLILFSTIQTALNLKQDKPTVLTLGTLFTSNLVARANVTGMSFPIIAGKKYKIEIIGNYQTAATTTGGSLGYVLSSGTGTIMGEIRMAITQGTSAADLTQSIYAVNATNTTAGSFITSTGVSAINAPHKIISNLIFDCLTTGVFQLQWGSEVAASSSQINSGMVMIVTTLN